MVKSDRLAKYGKVVKENGKNVLYLKEGVHTTINPIKDNTEEKLFNSK